MKGEGQDLVQGVVDQEQGGDEEPVGLDAQGKHEEVDNVHWV